MEIWEVGREMRIDTAKEVSQAAGNGICVGVTEWARPVEAGHIAENTRAH